MLNDGVAAVHSINAAQSRGTFASPVLQLYPEKEEPRHHWLDPAESAVRFVGERLSAPVFRYRLRVLMWRVGRRASRYEKLDERALDAEIAKTRIKVRRSGLTDANLVECFAVIREASRRTLGLFHHNVQVLGALAIARGAVAEMETGEGKSLTATLAVGAAGMAGMPAHVVTVNDYLAKRDAEVMEPLYSRLGLTVGALEHGIRPDERRAIYLRDVVYASNKEIVFDYLRDRVKFGGAPRNTHVKLQQFFGSTDLDDPPVMRGLHFAVVDEADSVLVDEARTPLILSSETDAEAERLWAETAHRLAKSLFEGRDYKIHRRERRIELTKRGKKTLERTGAYVGGIWENRIRREQAVRQALAVTFLYHEGDHYIISDGKVVIVDEYTGRAMEERSWSDGMHQLVEFKEGVEVTARKDVLARMTYQRFFRRYRHLAGMTGTAREVIAELSSVYHLNVVSIPTNVPSQRRRLGVRVFSTSEKRWKAVAERVLQLRREGRPVLVGTRSVGASEVASEALSKLNVPHELLNAKNDAREAEVIARAGERGMVLVATNMAGRGVDISLGDGVAGLGGLHVILTERHDSKRIDRQLEGRAARRGEPGSSEAMLSYQDTILEMTAAGRSFAAKLARMPGAPGRWVALHVFRKAQRKAENAHAKARRILLDQDRRLGIMLAFTSKSE
ncbi:preprotein translocase subunit SecA [Shimia sp. W99]